MTDKLQTDTVKVGDKQRIDRHLSLCFFTQLLFRDGQNVHQLIIQVNLQLRLHRQQRRRWGVFQVQHRIRDDLIAAHTKFNTAVRVDAAQHHTSRRGRNLRKGQLHIP